MGATEGLTYTGMSQGVCFFYIFWYIEYVLNKTSRTQNKILNFLIYLKLGQLYTKHNIF